MWSWGLNTNGCTGHSITMYATTPRSSGAPFQVGADEFDTATRCMLPPPPPPNRPFVKNPTRIDCMFTTAAKLSGPDKRCIQSSTYNQRDASSVSLVAWLGGCHTIAPLTHLAIRLWMATRRAWGRKCAPTHTVTTVHGGRLTLVRVQPLKRSRYQPTKRCTAQNLSHKVDNLCRTAQVFNRQDGLLARHVKPDMFSSRLVPFHIAVAATPFDYETTGEDK